MSISGNKNSSGPPTEQSEVTSLSHVMKLTEVLVEVHKAGLLAPFMQSIELARSDESSYRLMKLMSEQLVSESPKVGLRLYTGPISIEINPNEANHDGDLSNKYVPNFVGETKTIYFSNREDVTRYAVPFKRELSKFILSRFSTYKEFAIEVAMPLSSVSRFFQTNSTPRSGTLMKISNSLGIDSIKIPLNPDEYEEIDRYIEISLVTPDLVLVKKHLADIKKEISELIKFRGGPLAMADVFHIHWSKFVPLVIRDEIMYSDYDLKTVARFLEADSIEVPIFKKTA